MDILNNTINLTTKFNMSSEKCITKIRYLNFLRLIILVIGHNKSFKVNFLIIQN
jgi:hypothetical protein